MGRLLIFVSLLFSTCYAGFDNSRSFQFPSFSSANVTTLSLTGSASWNDTTGAISLCSTNQQSTGAVWYRVPMQVRGFTTTFSFKINNITNSGDGLAFVIQSSPYGSAAFGPGASGLGYGDYVDGAASGISNSIAIEFDTVLNADLGDLNSNHISIHTNSNGSNNAHENYSLGYALDIPWLANNQLQTVTISYMPNIDNPNLSVLFASQSSPSLTLSNITIDKYLTFQPGATTYVGFTAGVSNIGQAQDLLKWSFNFLGDNNAANSIALGISSAVAGITSNFTVQAYDQFNNTMITGGANFTATLSSEPTLAIDVIDNQNGTYSFGYVPTKSTSVQPANLAILLDGAPIKGSPFPVEVIAGAVSPLNCTAYESSNSNGLTSGTAGTVSWFEIQLRDKFGNNITNSSETSVSVSAPLVGPSKINPSASNLGNGIIKVDYTAYVSGNYSLAIEIDQVNISNPFHAISIAPGSVNGTMCITSPLSPEGVAGVNYNFVVYLRDTWGNNITENSQLTKVEVSLNGPVTIPGQVTWNETEHAFSATLTASISGHYSLQITIDGQPIMQTPFPVSILPQNSVWPPSCGIIQGTYNLTVAGNETNFDIQLRDYYRNNIQNNDIGLEWNVTFRDSETKEMLNKDQATFAATYTENGVYLITYNVTKSGILGMNVTINGTAIDHSPFSVHIQPTMGYGPNSWASGDATKETITDKLQTFEIFTRDRYNNPRTTGGDKIEITIVDKSDPSKVEVTPVVQDLGNSSYSATYKIKTSGDYLLQINVNGLPIQNSPYVLKCKWAGLGTPIILVIAGSIILALILGLSIFYFYKKKFSTKRLYNRLN